MSDKKYILITLTVISLIASIAEAKAADCTPHGLFIQKMNETYHTTFKTNCGTTKTQEINKKNFDNNSRQIVISKKSP